MKKIIWIASYPKSGNTWVRAIISSLLYSADGNFNFNLLKLIEVFEKKNRFDFVKDLNKKNYETLDKIENISKLWIEVQKRIVFDKGINPIYNIFKTHSANLAVNNNNFTDKSLTAGVIYIVRDPREILVSYSNHMGKKIDDAIDAILDQKRLLSPEKNLAVALMSAWHIHYESWKSLDVPKLLIKYEELTNNPKKEIKKISKFLGQILSIDESTLDKKNFNVFNTTQIEKFRNHEKNKGFDEASKNSLFFGNAKIDSWKEKLSLEQIKKIEYVFNKTMLELGYLG
tara:strand:+ start:94 stop:951 length:858 start_codon:yes stop_codon:yes gene_type:complete